MTDQKAKFMKEFAIKKNLSDKDFDDAIKFIKNKNKHIPSVVSIPSKKREAEEDTESLQEST